MIPEVEVTIIKGWPRVLSIKEAAGYLGISEPQLINVARLYPDKLRTFNLNPNGLTKFDREAIDEFVEWRKSIGVEKVA